MTALVICAVAIGFHPAHAAGGTFAFGNPPSRTSLSGLDPDTGATWATLSVKTINPVHGYMVTVALGSNLAALGNGVFVSHAIFSTPRDVDPSRVSITGRGIGLTTVFEKTDAPNVSAVAFDFRDCSSGSSNCNYGDANGRLQAGEYVSSIATFNSGQGDPFVLSSPLAAHVESIGALEGDSAGYTRMTTPAPQPKTYAMLLTGLGLMGFVATRRRRRVIDPAH
jgi:hypothetical protein